MGIRQRQFTDVQEMEVTLDKGIDRTNLLYVIPNAMRPAFFFSIFLREGCWKLDGRLLILLRHSIISRHQDVNLVRGGSQGWLEKKFGACGRLLWQFGRFTPRRQTAANPYLAIGELGLMGPPRIRDQVTGEIRLSRDRSSGIFIYFSVL